MSPIDALVDLTQTASGQFLLVMSAAVIAAAVLDLVGSRTIKRLAEQSRFDVDKLVYDESHLPIIATIVGVGFHYARLPLELPVAIDNGLGSLSITIVVLIWTRALLRVGKKLRDRSVTTPGEKDFTPIFQNIWTVVVLSGALFAILGAWGISLTPLLASAGIAGVAVGFAAKDTVANFFGSIALYADDTYAIGDFITLESGHEGWVEDISIRSTVIRTRDDESITVPNSVLNAALITNHSNPESQHRVNVPVSVGYGSDIDKVESLLIDIAESHDEVLDDPEPRVRFRELGDNGLRYDLLCWSPSPDEMKRISHELLREVYKQCTENDIEFPFPQRDVHLHTDSESETTTTEEIANG